MYTRKAGAYPQILDLAFKACLWQTLLLTVEYAKKCFIRIGPVKMKEKNCCHKGGSMPFHQKPFGRQTFGRQNMNGHE